jgi:hypothetical protein
VFEMQHSAPQSGPSRQWDNRGHPLTLANSTRPGNFDLSKVR